MTLYKKHLLWTTENRGNSHGFVTLHFENFSKICAITVGRKKTSLKHCYLHGIVTCPYFLGPENGVRFLRFFSFRCGWSCASQGMRHFQTSIAIDDNTSWSQHSGVLRFCCDTVWNVCSVYGSSPFRSTLNTSYITGLDMCEVCTEAVDSVSLWTRVTSQLWTCVKYVPKQSIP